jgi:membrane associated rhomboid family serine protease
MRPAAVGFHCPDDAAEASQGVRQPRTAAGGALPERPGLVTLVLIGLNLLAFLPYLAGGPVREQAVAWGAMLGSEAFFRDAGAVPGVAQGAYWRLLTSAFLHGSVLHIAFNMYALYLFGPTLERILGSLRFLALYLVCAVSGSVMAYWFTGPLTSTLGASGAVFGLFGAALILLYQRGQDVSFLLILLVLNVALSFRPGVSWQGHFGGLLAGLLIGAVIAYTPRAHRNAAQIGLYAVLIGGLAAAVLARTLVLT